MTTQELKQQIDKVLGNSIRCLLPSYWWKRAFGAVIDNTISKDEVKTINGESIVGEGDLRVGVKSVESVEDLEKLDAVVGDIASVGVESLEVVSAADLKESDSATFLDEWDSLTRIYKVELGEPFSEEGRHVVVMLHSKKLYLYDGIMLMCENGEFTCALFSYGDILMKSLDEINERLQNGDYRYLGGSYPDVIDKTYKLYVKESSANAYIKSDSWEKLSKEHIVSSEEELNALNVENGTIAKVASGGYMSILDCYQLQDGENVKNAYDKLTPVKGISLSVASGSFANQVIVALSLQAGDLSGLMLIVNEGNKVWCTDVRGEHNYAIIENGIVNKTALNDFNSLLKENDYRYGGCFEKNLQTEASKEALAYIDTWLKVSMGAVSDVYIKGETWTRLLKEGDVTGGGADITIDSELSDTSENAVQNKVVTAAIEELKNSNAGIISRTVYPTKTVFFGIEQDNEISETEREYNCETFRMAANNVIQLKGDTNAVVPLLALTEESATFGLFKYQAVIGPEKMLIFASYVIDKDGNVIVEVEIAESEHLISTINEKADKSDIKTINGVSLLGGGNLQLGDGQTIVYDDSAVYDRIAEVEELAAQAKVSSELAIEELNIHLEEVNEGLFEQVSQLMKDLDDLAERVRALENK